MKYIVLLCDGMSDLPCNEILGGKTPMQSAKKPRMDSLAKISQVGLAKTVPETLPPGSDVANLSVLGYNPVEYYTGRSPLEAASMEIEMSENDVAVRCNLVKLSRESDKAEFSRAKMLSYCADDIHTDKAEEIIARVQQEFGDSSNGEFVFHAGISYRHCLIWKNGRLKLDLVPPHDITGEIIGNHVKTNENNSRLLEMMEKSYKLLQGEQANCIWLWGEGKKSKLPLFSEKFGIAKSAMISAVDLLKGIGKTAGMDVIHVEGATGYIDTDFKGKADAAVNALKSGADLVYVHVEAPDECGHRGEAENKVKAIELIDELVLGRILEKLDGEHVRILITPDHPTPLKLMTHTRDAVPFMIYDSRKNEKGINSFDEVGAKNTGIYVENGYTLMEKLLCLN